MPNIPKNSSLSPQEQSSPKYSVILGAAGLHLVCEYPFWAVKVNMQNNPAKNKYFLETMKRLFQEKGIIRGFYPGAGPFFVLTLCKQSYRLPALSFLPDYFESWIPENWESRQRIPSIASASTLALFEAGVFGPIERIICYRVINPELPLITIRFLYTGAGVALGKGVFCWNLFSGLQNFAQTTAKRLLNTETLSAANTLGVGLFVGSSMTVINQPLSTLLTFAQTRPAEDKRTLLTAFGEHLKKHQAKALFAGIRPALMQGIVRSSITVFAIKEFRNKKPNL